MEAGNLLTITAANIRMNYKATFLPALVLLFVIPVIYGTDNLDYLQSADCLERMVALIGIPMFTALAKQELSHSLYETVFLRPVSLRWIILLRAGISIVGTLLLIFLFELYMRICGCSFPVFPYAVRTLAASMRLGLTGLLLSCIVQNTTGGYLGAFCLYLISWK